jgi:hypothetical protein
VPEWHPVQTIVPIEFHFPTPGTKEPFAVIRWVNVTLDGEPVSRWRAVTYSEPRRLVDRGYFAGLDDAAKACHRLALSGAVPPALDLQRR